MVEEAKIEEMSWKSLEEALEEEIDTVIMMMGSFEQHGPHLPLDTDTCISNELGERIAKRLDYALMGPTIPFGVSEHHMDFPGTISLSNDVFMEFLKEHCRAYDTHGFDFIALVPFHGGNFAPTKVIAPEIAKKMENAHVLPVADLEKNTEIMLKSLKEAGVEYKEKLIHSGATETSVMLAIEEEAVDKERLEKGYEGEIPLTSLFTEGLKYFTDNGVLGDPRESSEKAGEMILKNLSEDLAERIDKKREEVL